MRLLANENIPGPVVRRLREAGHDVLWAKEDLVVLFRIQWTDPATDNAFVVSALTGRDDWTGVFAVVERDRVRLRPLPNRTEKP